MDKILITGGAGFIGSHIAEKFYKEGYEIIIIDNLVGGNLNNLNHIIYKFYETDIRNKEKLEDIFLENQNIKYIFHHAAQVSVAVSVENPHYDMEENILGLVNILDMCKKYKVEKILFASTAAVYGIPETPVLNEDSRKEPLSPYGLSKLVGESYIQMYSKLYDLNYVIFRYANVYGPRQSAHGEAGVVSIFNDKMASHDDIFIDGDGEQTRDFIYVKDIANANFICAVSAVCNKILNVSTNNETSINTLFNKMKKYFNYPKEVKYREPRNGDIRDSCLDNKQIKIITSWKPQYTLDEGLQEYSNEI